MAEIVDTPANLYENPRNLFVAGFIGSPSMSFLPGRLEGEVVKTPIGDIPLSEPYVYFDVKTIRRYTPQTSTSWRPMPHWRTCSRMVVASRSWRG